MLEKVLDESAWVTEGKYQSPECINEMIESMANKVLRSLISDVQSHKWCSILADETRDLSNCGQMVICLRRVFDEYEVFEDLFNLIIFSTSDTIYSVLKNSLGLDFSHCRVQEYDKAQNFQGHVKGVAKRFKDENPAAILVHCLAHCTNFYFQDVANTLKKH